MQEALLSSETVAQSLPDADRQRGVRGLTKKCRALIGVLLLGLAPAVTEAGDPAPKPPRGNVPGPILIAGGGVLPKEIHDYFVEQAGGKEAKVVVIPGHKDADLEGQTVDDFWKQHTRVRLAVLLHAHNQTQADDNEYTKDLDDADAVWFSGGEQERFEQRYPGTKVEKKVKALHARGGIVGGTSAGAAFMSGNMIRKGAWEAEMGTGLDMVKGTIIEQHFLREGRDKRFEVVRKNFPTHRGIAIDDRTAVVIRGRKMWALGEGNVRVFAPAAEHDASKPVRILRANDGEPFDPMDVATASKASE